MPRQEAIPVKRCQMKTILVFIVILGLNAHLTMAAAPVDEPAKKCSLGQDFLKQHKHQEARTALDACIQKAPANAIAHFYLGDACQELKAWACAEVHYETSLELDAHSAVAGLVKQRGRKAKVWRLLDEGKQAISEPNAPPQQLAQAEDTLEIANKLGLDDEQRAIYQQLHEKIQQRHQLNHEKPSLAQADERSMVLVPAGEFTMGSWAGDADERPVHRVYLNAFLMDKYQMSVGSYATFLEATSQAAPPDWDIMNKPGHQNRPVVNVDWADANAYCKWAGKRLPTEAEREKATRGADGRIYPWGNELPTGFHANLMREQWSNHWALTPVGMFEGGKSPYGIYDMAGNVWEWVSDWYGADYYKTGSLQNPTGPPTGDYKVIRGGSWGSGPEGLRAAEREIHLPSFRGSGTGFRCAKTP
jgi:formylglycine-generating enzyme required for sulfatase activity